MKKDINEMSDEELCKEKNEVDKLGRYILLVDRPKIGKEKGDYYDNEFSDSIESLIKRGIIELEK